MRRSAAPDVARRIAPREPSAELRALVARLWRDAPPSAPGDATPGDPLSVAALQESLARLSLRAETLAVLAADVAPDVAPDAATLLAQVARSLHAMLDLAAAGRHDVLLRVARLERWLSLRAPSEPAAGCAADVALWVLEHLEGAARD